jgi:hypothetical protein
MLIQRAAAGYSQVVAAARVHGEVIGVIITST